MRARWNQLSRYALVAACLWLAACGDDISSIDDPSAGLKTPEDIAALSLDFVWIEPGSFTMGSPVSERDRNNDEAQHRVTLNNGFYLGKYEVTQGQWEAVMGTAPWAGQGYVESNPNHPAEYVSWDDAQAFINKLNDAAGKSIYRLPTEAEWEYAARAGATTRWSFGNDETELGNYAWYRDAGLQYAQPVGTKLPNPWTLHDMHGNVWEWCQDWYGPYPTGAVVDPQGPSTGGNRVLRGGFFGSYAQDVRSAGRTATAPGNRYNHFGFRLLRTE